MKEKTPSSKRIILGVDPGTTVMGYGLIAVNGKQMTLLHMDELVMNSKENHYLRLQKIFEKTIAIIDEFHPDEMALEAPFLEKMCNPCLNLGVRKGSPWLLVFPENWQLPSSLLEKSKGQSLLMEMPL